MRLLATLTAIAYLTQLCVAADAPKTGKWIKMFNGKDLTGWKALERPENWTVESGAITGRGERSHLFFAEQECENCEFQAKIWLKKGSNSGMYFRAKMMEGWPDGYEAQVNNSHTDPVRTASLYNIVKVFDQLVPDETWWTQHILADGNHIIIKVNGKTVVDHIEAGNKYTKGYLALQQHDPGSVVMYKDLMMRPLAAKK